MARVYILHVPHEEQLANYLSISLKSRGHKILRTMFEAGQEVDTTFKDAIRSSDIHVALISNNALDSKFFFNELLQSRNYTIHSNKKLFIPVYLPDLNLEKLPISIKNIHGIFFNGNPLKPYDIDNIAQEIDEAINLFLGKKLATEENAQQVKEKIESSAPIYIQETLKELNSREQNFKILALIWYFLGLILLVGGVYAAVWFSNNGWSDFGEKENWSRTIFFAIKSILIIILLIAASKYSFNLGKSYMNEALKIADRIHAISFGKFYLQIFNQQVEPSEIKEIFRDWNINNQSSFLNQTANDYDPKLLERMTEFIENLKSKG